MKKIFLKKIICLLAGLGMVLLASSASLAGVDVHYRYALADFSGPIKTFQGRLAVSRKTNEAFVLDPRKKDIRIFNEHGMEIFRLGENGEFNNIRDFTVDDESNIYALFSRLRNYEIDKYNFRGDPIGKIKLQDLPPQFADLNPSVIVWRGNRLYLAEPGNMRIVVVDPEGKYKAGYSVMLQVRQEIATTGDASQKDSILDMFGFNADDEGNMYFTLPVAAAAFRLSPDGTLKHFGKPGSTAGQFGVVSGITVDKQGYIYLTDKLRCVVMIYDKNFDFIKEFGFRGYGPSNLIVPSEVAVSNGNIFVSQAANRGVSVFKALITPDPKKLAKKE